ncbi:MAG: hypothetical protein D6723_01405 [Acidobacteria bacterium]|nr:MAG: hypothetical protein D6723_01405 [Acidobacteriota bacterium]
MMTGGLFNKYAPYIAALPARDVLTKDDLLIPTFLLHQENEIEIYYAPFDDVNEGAKIVLVGITPGWTQMEIAYRCARQELQRGMGLGEICAYAKRQASFAGSMRKNLITGWSFKCSGHRIKYIAFQRPPRLTSQHL